MNRNSKARGVSRRQFFETSALGTAVAAGAGAQTKSAEPSRSLVPVALRVNGAIHRLPVETRWSLLYVLRDRLNLTGTKTGCERGECGACTVLIDGEARYACLTLAVEADSKNITTIEGLLTDGALGRVQSAFANEDALQCGYCTPGQIMAAEGLLRKNGNPSMEQICRGMSGNLCRCGAYAHIFQAVRRAAGSVK